MPWCDGYIAYNRSHAAQVKLGANKQRLGCVTNEAFRRRTEQMKQYLDKRRNALFFFVARKNVAVKLKVTRQHRVKPVLKQQCGMIQSDILV